MRRSLAAGGVFALGAALMVPAGGLHYEAGAGTGCTTSHEMQQDDDQWDASTHRAISCEKCHGGALTLDASFHWNNVTRLYEHLRGDLPELIRFPNRYAQAMTARCQTCHRQEFAAWQAGPHSAIYSRIFLNK